MKKRKIQLTLIPVLIFTQIVAINVYADENSIREEIETNNKKIESLQNEQNQVEAEIDIENTNLEQINIDIENKTNEIIKIQNEIDNLQQEIDVYESEISDINDDIAERELKISEQNENIEKLRSKEIEIKKLLENRIVAYYKMDIKTDLIYTLLTSRSVVDFFENYTKISMIMKTDKKTIESLKINSEKIENETKILKSEMKTLDENKNDIEEKKNDLSIKQSEIYIANESKRKGLDELNGLKVAKSSLIASLENYKYEISSDISDLISFNSELQAEMDEIMAQANVGNNESSEDLFESFLRPTAGVISCYFGPRIDPISFVSGYHNGVDFADSLGTEIKASKSGTIELAGEVGGYGNCIIINHGNGEQTLYAHCNSFLVNEGQAVSQGETIATVGSTGYSTGPHLHFEIRINGTPVDPLIYVPS